MQTELVRNMATNITFKRGESPKIKTKADAKPPAVKVKTDKAKPAKTAKLGAPE